MRITVSDIVIRAIPPSTAAAPINEYVPGATVSKGTMSATS